MKTKAAVLREVDKPLVLEELDLPKLLSGQVLVKVLCSGLCHSQLNEIKGWKGREFIPHLMGHEASGIVIEVGEGVEKVKEDDYVAISWIKGAGLDLHPPVYRSPQGKVNAGSSATFAEYAIVSENRVVKIPESVEPYVASILGCAVLTGMGIIDGLDICDKNKVIVFGIGGVGASSLMRIQSLFPNIHCVAVDPLTWKLEWAKKELGVNETRGPSEELQGFDLAIECSGSKSAMERAFECLNDKGTAVIAGNIGPREKISIVPFDLLKGKKIVGSWSGDCFIDNDIPFYVSLYLARRLPLKKLITKIYPFEKVNEGLDDLRRGSLIRGVLKIS